VRQNSLLLAALSLASFSNASFASTTTLPVLVESFPAPGAASQLRFSDQYGLLFLRNSGSAIRVVDTTTHSEIDLHLANQQFTDMDLTPDGQYLYAADWGRVATGYGTLTNPHYVHRYNLATRQWESKQSTVDTYKLEAVDANRIILLESDQWVDVNLVQWGAASTMTPLAHASADYYGDIEYDPITGRVYHGNSGSSSREINVLRLVGNTFTGGVGTGTYGTAQNGGGTSTLSTDGSRFYYGALQVEALDVTNNIRTFPQQIYAATPDLAFGSSAVYDAKTGATVGSFGFTSTAYALDQSGNNLWAYANNTLYHYSVPEPASGVMLAMGVILLAGDYMRRLERRQVDGRRAPRVGRA
jgi:hypothetical protein